MTDDHLQPPPPPPRRAGNARLAMAVAVAVTIALYFVPYGHHLAYPLVLVSTFVHEMGHGIAGVLVGGRFEEFVMYADASGRAQISGAASPLARAIVPAGGLIGPSIGAALFFWLCTRPRLARVGLWIVAVVTLGSCLWVVRNPFGWVFAGTLGAILMFAAMKAGPALAQWTLAFFAVQLTLSVYSRGDYLFTPVARTATGPSPSDVALMSQALFLPYWFWGVVCGAISVGVLVLGLMLFWRATR